MADSIDSAVVAAARSIAVVHLSRSDGSQIPEQDLAVLVRSVEAHSFKKGAIVPIQSVVRRAAQGLRVRLQSDAADQEVAAAWVAEIELALHDFSVQPEGWEEADAQAFMSSCGRTFGVHDVLVPSLLRMFHSRAESARFAIMVKLLRAEPFAYLRREIETMPEEMNLDIDDPTAALRALVRDVFAGSST